MTFLQNKIDLSSIFQLDVLVITIGTGIVMGGYLYYKGYFSNTPKIKKNSTNINYIDTNDIPYYQTDKSYFDCIKDTIGIEDYNILTNQRLISTYHGESLRDVMDHTVNLNTVI